MMQTNVRAIKENHEMHLTNAYNYKFGEVVKAFVKKYENQNTTWATTTIAHVSQIDQDKF